MRGRSGKGRAEIFRNTRPVSDTTHAAGPLRSRAIGALGHDAHDERVREVAVIARRRHHRYGRQAAVAVGGVERQEARSGQRLEGSPYPGGHTRWNTVDLHALDGEHRCTSRDRVQTEREEQCRHADQH